MKHPDRAALRVSANARMLADVKALVGDVRRWLSDFEVVWLGWSDAVLLRFRRPDYESRVAWKLYAGFWLIRRYKR